MGAFAGPDISESGLVLALDAGNSKGYDSGENLVTDTATDFNYSFNNQIISTANDVAPNGTTVLCKHDLTGASSPFLNCRANTSLTAGTYTMSMYLKGTTSFSASFAFVGETTNEIYANTANITTTWQRFTLTFTLINTQTSSRLQVFFSTQGNDKVISVWGAQLERGSVATDYTTRPSGIAKTRGTTWTDLSGNGYGGSLVGSTSYSSSPSKFDTNSTAITDQNYLTTSSEITFADGSEYTWDFYIKLRSSVQVTYQSLLGRNSTNPWLSLYPTTSSATSWNIRYRQSGATYYNTTNINYDIINNWGNITLSVDSSRNVNVYLNGELKETINPTTTLFYVNVIAGGYSSGGSYYPLQGSIASCKLYNRALTPQEIQQNFNALRSRFQ